MLPTSLSANNPATDLDLYGFHIFHEYLDGGLTRSLVQSFEELSAATRENSATRAAARVKRGVVFAVRNLLSVEFVQAFLSSKPVRALIDPILPGAVAVRAILFDKTGNANWTVPWHQDRSIAVRKRIDLPGFGPWSEKAGVVHVQPTIELLRQMVTLRFSLDACDADNGPLRVIAGSHRDILDQTAVEQFSRHSAETKCTTAAGGVVLMRPLLLHASSPARRPRHRRVLHIEMGPPELPGGLEWARA